MEIIFLGTNGWYDSAVANTVCTLIKTKRHDIVLDAGNGIYRLDKYVDGSRHVYLFLSHFHLDHIMGLHILPKFNFKKGMTICAGYGVKKALNSILRSPFTMPLNKLKFNIRILELPAQAGQIPFSFRSLPLVHSDPVLGYRFEIDGKIVAYCTDTGYCKNAVTLAKEADVLVCECSHKRGENIPGWPHMNPESAAVFAQESGPGKLVLTHFGADRYPLLKDRTNAGRIAVKIFKNTIVATDGLKIKL